MARVCELCGKGTIAGHNVQHHSKKSKWRYKAPKTNRVFRPNLQKLNIEIDGKLVKKRICMKCYKKIRKEQK